MAAPRTLRLPDGRTLAYDEVGDPSGPAVVYLHGTPDSRLARPPDDQTAAAGVRLLAVDRPGAGDSDPDPHGTLASIGADLEALLDGMGVERALLLGWSAGGLFALAAATRLADRVAGVGLVGALPPVEAYLDAEVVAALGPARRGFVDLAGEVPRAELAAEAAPFLVPDPPTAEAVRAHVLEGAGEVGRRELSQVPGAVDAVVAGVVASVRQGRAGLEADLRHQLEPGLDLAAVRAPVRTFHGGHDPVSPPSVGTWLVARLPTAVLDLSPEAGHHLLFPRWRGILRALRRDAGM